MTVLLASGHRVDTRFLNGLLDGQFFNFWVLSLVRVLVASVDLELGQHLEGQLVFGEHPADGFLDDQFRTAARRFSAVSARICVKPEYHS